MNNFSDKNICVPALNLSDRREILTVYTAAFRKNQKSRDYKVSRSDLLLKRILKRNSLTDSYQLSALYADPGRYQLILDGLL